MNRIASFSVDHEKLLTGIYVSRRDKVGGEIVTTFDLRFCRPNVDAVMETGGLHAIEHLGATFLRNDAQWSDKTIYFGPMGCRTGFYVIFKGDLVSEDIVEIIRKMCDFILDYEGLLPGESPKECGNYKDLDLAEAKDYTKKFVTEVLDNICDERLNYPE